MFIDGIYRGLRGGSGGNVRKNARSVWKMRWRAVILQPQTGNGREDRDAFAGENDDIMPQDRTGSVTARERGRGYGQRLGDMKSPSIEPTGETIKEIRPERTGVRKGAAEKKDI